MTAEITSSFVTTPYGRFHVESAGEGEPVLLIHGGTASAREWRPVLPALGEYARCVAMDRLGCGESDRSSRGYDRQTLTASLFALADALGWERFAAVGQSFGGFWALSMAFAQPERLTGLVVVDGAAGAIDEQEIGEWEKRWAARPQPPTDVERYVDFTMQQIFADPSRVPASFRDDLRFQFEHAAPGQIDAVAEDRRTVMPYASLRMPTLVVWGEQDSMAPPARGRRLAEAIPGARFVGLPGVGHTCQVEAPAEFVAAVAPFLNGLAGSPSPAVQRGQR